MIQNIVIALSMASAIVSLFGSEPQHVITISNGIAECTKPITTSDIKPEQYHMEVIKIQNKSRFSIIARAEGAGLSETSRVGSRDKMSKYTLMTGGRNIDVDKNASFERPISHVQFPISRTRWTHYGSTLWVRINDHSGGYGDKDSEAIFHNPFETSKNFIVTSYDTKQGRRLKIEESDTSISDRPAKRKK
jgi:hypothetical protein